MYKLSWAAARDVEDLLERSIHDFGLIRTKQYYQSLKHCLELLAGNPDMGSIADDIRPGYRRFLHRSHVIFYTSSGNDIFVIRILHKSVDIIKHFD